MSADWFALRALIRDKKFVATLVGSMIVAGLVEAAAVGYFVASKVPVDQIVKVSLSVTGPDASAKTVPISQIGLLAKSDEKSQDTILSGYVVKLDSLCSRKERTELDTPDKPVLIVSNPSGGLSAGTTDLKIYDLCAAAAKRDSGSRWLIASDEPPNDMNSTKVFLAIDKKNR